MPSRVFRGARRAPALSSPRAWPIAMEMAKGGESAAWEAVPGTPRPKGKKCKPCPEGAACCRAGVFTEGVAPQTTPSTECSHFR